MNVSTDTDRAALPTALAEIAEDFASVAVRDRLELLLEFSDGLPDLPERYVVDGAGIDATQVERAIALSHEKYCSVAATLAPDLEVRSVAVVNGREGGVHLARENQ